MLKVGRRIGSESESTLCYVSLTLNSMSSVRLVLHCMFALLLFSAAASVAAQENMPEKTHQIAFVVHGGAGTIERDAMTPEREKEYRSGLEHALKTGYEILQRGGSSLDAVEAAVRTLEDDPHFNAGKGAVFTSEGVAELDASIMDGKTLKAGAVASVRRIKNPVSLARLVMEKSPHVLLDCSGAEAFAKEQGIELVDPKYFFTQRRWNELKEEQTKKSGAVTEKHGTVGAVALDRNGDLAAATSTGGTTNKRPGRIGDTPVIGAGTYANNQTCAVSCTGDGEYFIRAAAAHEVSALMKSRGHTMKA